MKKEVSPVSFLRSHRKWLMFVITLGVAAILLFAFLPRSSDSEVDRIIEEIEDLTGLSVETKGFFDGLSKWFESGIEEQLSAQIVTSPETSRVSSATRGELEFDPDAFADALVGQIETSDDDSFPRVMQATFEILEYFFPRIRNEIQIVDPLQEEEVEIPVFEAEVPTLEEIPLDDSVVPILRNLNVADTNVLFHPSGEVLSWGMFYKFYYQKVTGQDSLPMAAGDTVWFQPYERWFRQQQPRMNFYVAADPADPAVVRQLYNGLPAGVYSGDTLEVPEVATASPGLVGVTSDDYTTQVLKNDADAYTQRFLSQFESQKNFYDARGNEIRWSDFVKLLAYKEGVTIAPPQSGESAYESSRRWFQSRYPGVAMPAAEDVVTLVDARFYLDNVLPEGSYGVDSSVSSLLADLAPSAVEVAEADPIVMENEDLFASFTEFFRSLAGIVRGLVDDDNIALTEKELRENADLRADVEELVFGRAPASALDHLTAEDQEILDWLQAQPLVPSLAESVETAAAVYGSGEVPVELQAEEISSLEVIDVEHCTQDEEGLILDDNPLCNP